MFKAGLEFPTQSLKSILSGLSAIDLPRLEFQSLEEVGEFLKTYGYDLSQTDELESVWRIYDQAIEILSKHLLEPGEQIPAVIASREKLKDIRHLFLYASTIDHSRNTMQQWACALLRVMHCVAHVENDLFFNYTEAIQEQVLKPLTARIVELPHGEIFLGAPDQSDQIPLAKYETKAFKEMPSMVIKTLSKPETVALDIFDKMGVRFITNSIYDAFRVLRFLRRENIVNFANVVPHQSRNTLYPTNLFFETLHELIEKKKLTSGEQIEAELKKKLEDQAHRARYKEKHNPFSGDNYRAIKFICRQLVKVRNDQGATAVRFFYPYEIQIMDREMYVQTLTGQASHGEYKARQRLAARERVLGEIRMGST